jgi:hypothetical protein
MILVSFDAQIKKNHFDMCHSLHFRKVFIETPTNAPVYYTSISLHVSTLLGHHQGFTWNTEGYSLKCV